VERRKRRRMRRRRRWVSSWDLSHAPLTFFLSPFSALSARPLPPKEVAKGRGRRGKGCVFG